MPYLVIEDFKGGLDYRRSPLTSPPGTLRVLRDCHVNRGGEIESRKRFESVVTLPANTFGLAEGLQLPVVFGSVSIGSTSGYGYSQITPGGGLSMTGLVAACAFRSGYFVIARMSDSTTRYYYNGAPIAGTEPIVGELFPVDCMTFKNNVYMLSAGGLYRSKIGDASLWKTSDTGAFVIDLSESGMPLGTARALGVYEGLVVVYGSRQIQFWSMDPDPSKCQLVRTIENIGIATSYDSTGIITQKSAVSYGDRDAFFLSQSGVRSLRVRDSSGTATVNDVGDPIDALLQADFPGAMASAARPAIVDPVDGRYWIAFGDRIFVYSRSDGVSAWSEYQPGFTPTNMAVAGGRVFLRSGNTIYRYGGANNDDHTGVRPFVEFPMLDFGRPATFKMLEGIDAAVEGAWEVFLRSDHLSPGTAWEKLATLSNPTFQMARIAARAHGTHFALRFSAPAPGGYHRLANAVMHYQTSEAG